MIRRPPGSTRTATPFPCTPLFRSPVDQGELLRHYTLSDEDLGHIRQRRRAHNRFGFALQLCVLRYPGRVAQDARSEEHTSELQSLMRISYAVFCLKKNTTKRPITYSMLKSRNNLHPTA